jgi:succinyl-CoA synthetase beta subunit
MNKTDPQAARAILSGVRESGRTALRETEAKQVLAAFGIDVPASRLLPPHPAGPFGEDLRPPFALKIVSRDILHKTEVGGVRIGLPDTAAATEAIAEMGARIAAAGHTVEGWLLEEMAPRGIEMVVGGLHDVRFGPVMMCGFGGVLVELLDDIGFAICPVDAVDCDRMIDALRGRGLLAGWRGAPPAAIPKLCDVLLRIGGEGGLLQTLGSEIAELDVNPLIVSSTGAVAADARIILGVPR